MNVVAETRTSIVGLVRELTNEVKTFLRQEIQLAKTEMTEKATTYGRNAAALGIGGVAAAMGAIVFLIGLGFLLGWAFQLTGLNPIFAVFLGLCAIGLFAMGTGGALVAKGIASMKKQSIAPERTIHTLQELRGSTAATAPLEGERKASSEQLQRRVEATESQMGNTLEELGERLSPQHIKAEVKHRIQEQPYTSGLLAIGMGLLSGLLLGRRHHRA